MAFEVVLYPEHGTSALLHRSGAGRPWPTTWQQSHGEEHMLIGFNGTDTDQYRHLLSFDTNSIWNQMTQLVKAELHIFSANDHVGLKTQSGQPGNLKVGMKLATWAEGGGGETVWTGSIPTGTAFDAGYTAIGSVSATPRIESVVNVTNVVARWVPKDKKGPTGAAGAAKPNYGMVLMASGTDAQAHQREAVMGSENHQDSALWPFLVFTIEPLVTPGNVVLGAPDGTVAAGTPLFFTGEYEPGDANQKMTKVEVKVTAPGKADDVWTHNADANEVATSLFSVPSRGLQKSGTTYAWTARVYNNKGGVTPYASPTNSLVIGTTAPTLVALAPLASQTYETLDSLHFQARYTASAVQFHAASWQVQLRTSTSPSNPTWGEDLRWDSGLLTAPNVNAATQVLDVLYGGPALAPSTAYSYRMQARDAFGGTSAWVYGTLNVGASYIPSTADTRTNLTRYGAPPPFRIRIFGMGTKRGPGKLLAELTDASNVGASEFYNNAGEFYFTLPVTHPQAPVIEPYQTHYALEHHTGQGWVGKTYGLITDFDATEDEVVFYGTDYLGLLARCVEERFDPTSADLDYTKGGGKYSNIRIDTIVRDQLTVEKAKTNSPVGFIEIGDIADMPNKVIIYSSFKQRLPFIAGLIDSFRAGTGRKTRIVCERNTDGQFRWRVLLNPGLDRANLRFEYGGLAQGFRTIPFSNWGTAVDAIGRTVQGTRVYSARSVAPGFSEATWGAFPSPAMYADINDVNDLRRRANQAAARIAKVGKMLGIGIRVGALGVKDGWDITDSLPMHIQRGVVDTTRWGSDYWTVWGWTWSSFPDGHSNLVLSLAPREDTVAPDPDLIAAKPILSDKPNWSAGYGIPKPVVPTLVQASPSVCGGNTSSGITVGLSTPPTPGNYLVFTAMIRGYSGSVYTPAGWTLVGSAPTYNDNGCRVWQFRRLAQTGDPAVFSFSTDANFRCGSIVEISANTFTGALTASAQGYPSPGATASFGPLAGGANAFAVAGFAYATNGLGTSAVAAGVGWTELASDEPFNAWMAEYQLSASGSVTPTAALSAVGFDKSWGGIVSTYRRVSGSAGLLSVEDLAPTTLSSSPPNEEVTSFFYLDLDTGCVWQWDGDPESPYYDGDDFSEGYTIVYCPEDSGGGGGGSSNKVWMPLTTIVGGVPELVWESNGLVPTEVPI